LLSTSNQQPPTFNFVQRFGTAKAIADEKETKLDAASHAAFKWI
jgi:hypothetical protein